MNNFRNGKINPIAAGNELQRIGITGSPSGISKDGRIENGRIAETSSVKQDQKETSLIRRFSDRKSKKINNNNKTKIIMKSTCDISLKDILNTEEAVCYTSISDDTLRMARELRLLPYHKLGRNILYRRIDLKTYVESLPYYINGVIKNRNNGIKRK